MRMMYSYLGIGLVSFGSQDSVVLCDKDVRGSC